MRRDTKRALGLVLIMRWVFGISFLILIVSLQSDVGAQSARTTGGKGNSTGVPKSRPTQTVRVGSIQPDTSAPSCVGWSLYDIGQGGLQGGQLRKLAVVSPSDVWAVGFVEYRSQFGGDNETLAEHWNGISWSVIPTPDVRPPITDTNSYLTDVSAVSSQDVWTIGYYTNCTNHPCTGAFAGHWDGAQWSVVPEASVQNDASFGGVAALATNNVWIVGTGQDGKAFTEHWNGVQWSVIPISAPGSSSFLAAVAAVSSDDVWAVGGSSTGGPQRTLVEHWNGSAWEVVPSSNIDMGDNSLKQLSVASPDSVWAIGTYATSNRQGGSGPLIERWNGTIWEVMATPSIPSYGSLYALAAIAPDNVWAVGSYGIDGSYRAQPLSEHWDGTEWNIVPTPVGYPFASSLNGVAAVTATDIWGVGATVNYSDPQQPLILTLIEHYSEPAASCAMTFTDVSPDNPFFPYVRCLACRNIVGGYSDDTFRPNNPITRGQLAKMVGNAKGPEFAFQGGTAFEDVPYDNIYSGWIDGLAYYGYASGYACGGAGEPCVPPGNLPYFRPNASATRGQISKIVSNAVGFRDTPSGQQFQDIAPGSTYYAYIYRLAIRHVMAGYQCGIAPAGPCVPPNNLPYFLPNNNATRGQTSKIVSNAFFP